MTLSIIVDFFRKIIELRFYGYCKPCLNFYYRQKGKEINLENAFFNMCKSIEYGVAITKQNTKIVHF